MDKEKVEGTGLVRAWEAEPADVARWIFRPCPRTPLQKSVDDLRAAWFDLVASVMPAVQCAADLLSRILRRLSA